MQIYIFNFFNAGLIEKEPFIAPSNFTKLFMYEKQFKTIQNNSLNFKCFVALIFCFYFTIGLKSQIPAGCTPFEFEIVKQSPNVSQASSSTSTGPGAFQTFYKVFLKTKNGSPLPPSWTFNYLSFDGKLNVNQFTSKINVFLTNTLNSVAPFAQYAPYLNVNENGEIAWLLGSGAPCQAGDATVTLPLNYALNTIQLFTIVVDGAPGDQISWASAGGAVHDCVTYHCDGLLNVISNNTSVVFPAPSACTPAKNLSFDYTPIGSAVAVSLNNLMPNVSVEKLDGVIHIQPVMNGLTDLDFTSQNYTGGPLMEVIRRKNPDGSFDFYYQLKQAWTPTTADATILLLQHSGGYNTSQGAQLVCSAAFGRVVSTNFPNPPLVCALGAIPNTLTVPGSPACGSRLLISTSRYVGPGCELGVKYVITHNAPAPIQLASLKLRFQFKLFNGVNSPGAPTTTLPCPSCGVLTDLSNNWYEYNYNQTNLTLSSGGQIIVPFNLNTDCISYFMLAAEAVPTGGSLCALATEFNPSEYPACNPQVIGSVRMANEALAPFYRVDLLSNTYAPNPPYTLFENHTDCAFDYSFCPDPATAPFQLKARLGTDWGVRPHCSCGVTTYDLVLITKHILGLQLLPSPYAIIAADANRSIASGNIYSTITSNDIIQVRRCILGLQKDYGLKSAEPWYYIRKNYVFPNPNNPFNPGTYIDANVSDVPPNGQLADYGKFIAVHTGDVNQSCNCGTNLLPGDDRSAGVEIGIDAQRIRKDGRTLTVPFHVSSASSLVAAQFGLRFDQSALRLREIVPNGSAKVSRAHFGAPEEGILNFAWSTPDGETPLPKQTTLFTLSFDLLEDHDPASLNKLVWLSGSALESLAYTADGANLPLRLDWQHMATAPAELRVSASPNPFIQSTPVHISVEIAQIATVRLTNVQGATLSTQQLNLPAGETTLDLEAAGYVLPGVYFLTVETPQAKVIRRLVKI